MKVRKVSVIIEAVAVRDFATLSISDWEGWKTVPAWVREGLETGTLAPEVSLTDSNIVTGISVLTHHGSAIASLDDYVMRGVDGELYPCKKAIFDTTYEIMET